MLKHDIKYVEVETDSLSDVERGLREDMNLIWSYLSWIRNEVNDLEKVWNNADHDDFVEGFGEYLEGFSQTLDGLKQLVEAFAKAEEYYHKLSENISAQKAKMQGIEGR